MKNLLLFYVLLGVFLFTSCGQTTQKVEDGRLDEKPETTDLLTAETGVVLFYGTSLTAGYGLDPSEAYPALIQEKIDSLDLKFEVINAGLSGETTAGGNSRLDWVLNQQVDIFILELGANDGLRGVPLEETRRNLQEIVEKVKENNSKVEIIVAGMQIPPNMGRDYATEFRNIFPELAEKNDLHIIPFLLDQVGGIRELNQADGIHPTARGQQIMAGHVWDVLEPLLKEKV